MEVNKLYERIGTDYNIILERFCSHEELICRFILSFPEDLNYQKLTKAVETFSYLEIESYAHALKGVSANLGFVRLQEASNEVVMEVRQNRFDEIPQSFQKVKQEYDSIIKEIQDMKSTGGLE